MSTCPECNRFLGDAGHASTCSKRGLSPVASDPLLDVSLRLHAKEIVEYILRGNGRRIVPKAIYLAAWEIQYALNRASNDSMRVAE